MALWGGNSCWLPRNNGFRKMKKLNRICFSSPKKANAIRVCVPECHFPGTGIFPEKSGKSSVPSIREEDVPIPAFGTGYFPSSIRSGITREFLSASRMKIKKKLSEMLHIIKKEHFPNVKQVFLLYLWGSLATLIAY